MSRQALLSWSAASLFALPWVVSAQETQRPADPRPAAKQQLYTCPMHPEIQWSRPDNCPICNMKLVAKRTKAPSRANGMAMQDHAGMSMDGHAMDHDHHAMGSMMMGGCAMCMEMMGMGGTGSMSGMQSHRARAPAQSYRATRPVYRCYSGAYSRGSSGGPSVGCGC